MYKELEVHRPDEGQGQRPRDMQHLEERPVKPIRHPDQRNADRNSDFHEYMCGITKVPDDVYKYICISC